ncbi:heat shock protein 70, partial [Reticulomyxa filosa]
MDMDMHAHAMVTRTYVYTYIHTNIVGEHTNEQLLLICIPDAECYPVAEEERSISSDKQDKSEEEEKTSEDKDESQLYPNWFESRQMTITNSLTVAVIKVKKELTEQAFLRVTDLQFRPKVTSVQAFHFDKTWRKFNCSLSALFLIVYTLHLICVSLSLSCTSLKEKTYFFNFLRYVYADPLVHIQNSNANLTTQIRENKKAIITDILFKNSSWQLIDIYSIMTNKIASIGIDLGMTYSCVGTWKNNTVEIIPNNMGERTTPSCVSFSDTERLVGTAARYGYARNSENT